MSRSSAPARPQALRRALSSVRGRALAVVVGITAITVLLIGAATHWVRYGQIEAAVVESSQQEAQELQRLLDRGPGVPQDGAVPPVEAAPPDAQDARFETADHLLWTFMSTTVPAPHEVIVGVIDGEVRYTYDGAAGEGLSTQEIERAVADLGQEGRTVHTLRTAGGRTVGYGLISVEVPGDDRSAYLVVASDITEARGEVWDSWWRYVGISLVFLILASVMASYLIGRVTAPISRLREATEAVSAQELTRRVDVPGQDSDIARLALTFNSMLDRLERGFEEQRQLLDDAAHELRTPLTILHGNLELMDVDDLADIAETRELMLDEMSRMNRLVEDLLLLARSRRPDFIRTGEVETGAFLDDAFARVRTLSEDRLWVVDARPGGQLVADRERLMQAVIQLAANAVKFSEPGDTIALGALWVEGGIRAAEEGEHDDGPGRRLELWVRDTGIGIDPQDQRRIFERFGRAAAGRTVEGSGLGLSIVSAIAAGHGGRIALRSSPGDGSWFTLHLPAEGPEGAAEGRSVPAAPDRSG